MGSNPTQPIKEKKMHNAVVFLSDGETWTTIDGCSICILTDEQLDYLSIGDKRPEDLNPIMEISLGDCTPNWELS